MSREINLAIVDILEDKQEIPKQRLSDVGTYYDDLCHGLPLALVGRPYNEVECGRVWQFLTTLYYDFQFANTIRAIFKLKNAEKIEHNWAWKLVTHGERTKYFWEQLDNINSRIRFTEAKDRKTFLGMAKVLFRKLKKGMPR